MDRLKKIASKYSLLAITFLVFVYNLLHILKLIAERGLSLCDFHARWQENAYLLHGIDPFRLSEANVINSIGYIQDNMITVPWAWLLGIFINPGFLPYEIAKIWGFVVLIILFVICMYVVYQYADRKLNLDKTGRWTMVMLLGSSLYWWFSIFNGNNGMIAALIIIIAICICDKHPVATGILMTLAMIKPQLAAVFYLVLLVQKRFLPIIVSAITGIVSVLTVSLMLKISPFVLVGETAAASGVLNDTYIGIFDQLRYYGLSLNTALYMDIAAGCVFFGICVYMLCKYKIDETLIWFTVPTVMQSFWFYKQTHDNIIICILMMSFALIFYRTQQVRIRGGCLLCIILLITSFYLTNLVSAIGEAINTSFSTEQLRSIYRTLEVSLFIIMEFVLLCLAGKFKVKDR